MPTLSLNELIDQNGQTTPPVDPPTPPVPPVDPPDPTKNPDGTIKTPEQLAEEKRLADEAAAAAGQTGDDDTNQDDNPDNDQEVTVEQFFTQVDALRGDDLSKHIDYGQVDPMSPEGFMIREDFIANQARLQLEEDIKNTDPRAYAYLLHRQNGGTDEDFFKVKSFVLPALDQVKESVDLQRNVLSEAYRAKGIPEKQIGVLIKTAIDSGELLADAEAAYKEIQDRDLKAAEDSAKVHEARVKQQRADISSFDGAINNTITTGKDLRFQIPAADQSKFAHAIKENIHYENGQFFLIKPLNKDNLAKVLDIELFGYLGGDLTKMIQKASNTANATRFINKTKQADQMDKNKSQSQATPGKTLAEL